MPSSPIHRTSVTLPDASAAPAYFASISEVVLQIERAKDTSSIINYLREVIHRIGAEVGTFVSCIEDDEYRTCRFLLACDPRWYSEYERRAWSSDDPWLQYCRRHAEPIRASEIPARNETQVSIVRLAEQYDFRSAVVVPAPVGGGLTRLGMLCLGSADPQRFEGEAFVFVKVAALPVAAALNRWCTERAREELLQSKNLAPEDLVLLDLQRQGMTTKQMVRLTNMSAKSINSRFQRINAKLRVRTRKAAARRAAEYGLI